MNLNMLEVLEMAWNLKIKICPRDKQYLKTFDN